MYGQQKLLNSKKLLRP